MLHGSRNVQHLALADRNFLAADKNLQGALQDVGHLLAVMGMHRHEATALEIYLSEHLALAGHNLSRDHLGNFFERDLVPAVQPNGVRPHDRAEYTIRPGCYNLRE